MTLQWTEPTLLTNPGSFSDNSDQGSLPEADVIWLGGDVAVVGCFSGDSYILRLWGINIAGPTPVVGDVNYFYGFGDNDWIIPPLPVDVKLAALNDLSFLIPTTGNNFVAIGQYNEAYDSAGNLDHSGNYIHAATFFHLDPTTLVITRTAFCVVDSSLINGGDVQAVTGCAWGDKVVITIAGAPALIVASPDGSVVVHDALAVFNDGYIGAPVVRGDVAYFLSDPGLGDSAIEYSFDLNTGDLESWGGVNQGQQNYTWFSARRPDGVLMWTAASYRGDLSSFNRPVYVYKELADDIGDPFELLLADSAIRIGWTYDWYGNARAITVWPDNTTIVSYNTGGVMTYSVVTPEFTVAESGPVSTFTSAGQRVQTERMCSIGQDRLAAIQVRQVAVSGDIPYGLRFTMTPGVEPEMITGQIDNTRIRFI